MAREMTPRQLLLAVAEGLDAHPEHWTRYMSERTDPPECGCLIQLMAIRGGLDATLLAKRELECVIRGQITVWNDHVARDAAEVAAVCRRAAERLKEGE